MNKAMLQAVKFADPEEKTVSGLAAPYGGPFGGKDLEGEFFSPATDFALKWYDDIPLLYHHGHDDEIQTEVVGRVKSRKLTDAGVWAQAQLDASSEYFEAIKDLVRRGKLFFSSGAVSHLVETTKSGEIKRWPMIEVSLTPTPANLLATTAYKGDIKVGRRNSANDQQNIQDAHDSLVEAGAQCVKDGDMSDDATDSADGKSIGLAVGDPTDPPAAVSASAATVVNMTDLAQAFDQLVDNAIAEFDAAHFDEVDALLSALAVVSDQQLALLGAADPDEADQ